MRNFYLLILTCLCCLTAHADYIASDFVGVYDFKRSVDGWSDYTTTPVSIALGDDDNTLEVHGLLKDYVVHAIWDAEAGYLYFPNQLIDSENDVWLKFAGMDMSTFTIVPGEGPFRAYPDNGDLIYEDMDGFGFFTSDDEALELCMDPVFYLTVSLAPEEWNVLSGKATYSDGWVAPGLTVEIPAYEVDVWQNIANPNLYAVVDPYGPSTPFAPYNLNATGEGFIIVDVTDPACVMVRLRIFSGMTINQSGYETDMYNFNAEALYHTLSSMSNEEIIAKLASQNLEPSTFDGSVITIHNCVFADQDDLYESYTFNEDLTAVTTITLPPASGLNAIAQDNDDTSAEYFNLQGIRVANPTSGCIYIMRQGDTVKKIRY